jgi:predicted dehydrogenase
MKKVVVVGFGFMGMTHSLNIFKNQDLELVAIVDKDIESIDQKLKQPEGNFATGGIDPQKIQKVNKYHSLSDCIDKEEFDAIHVCVHTSLHYQIAKESLLAGKHVLLEKPFSLDIEECKEIIDLANNKDLILMVAHVLRFMPPYQKLKSLIEDEEFGSLKFLSLTRFSGIPLWGEWAQKQSSFGSSGGALFDLLIHDIDFVNFLFGKPIKIKSKYLPGRLSEHDYISAWWEYPEFVVKVEGGNTFHSNFPFQAGFMAEFEKASVLFSTNDPDNIHVSNHDDNNPIKLDEEDGFFNEIDYFKNCLVTKSKPDYCTAESALESIKLCYQHLE